MALISIDIDFKKYYSHPQLVADIAPVFNAKPGDEVNITITLRTYYTLLYADFLLLIVSAINHLKQKGIKVSGRVYADANDELQHSVFYNFGNNARKFLEALLFYKYPSRIENQTMNSNTKRLLKYFGADNQATVLTERVNNELSHLEEIFDRGMVPIDIPEITKVAKFILEKMESNDIDQYEALLESIGVLTTN